MAKYLSQHYPDSRFAVIAGSKMYENKVITYLKNQTDVVYENIYYRYDIRAKALKENIDYQALEEFERSSDYKSLWRMIAADREWGHTFQCDAVFQGEYIHKIATRENILKLFSGKLKFYRQIFDEFKPDVFMPAMFMGSFLVYIYEQLCREKKVRYVLPIALKIKNLFAFSSNVQGTLPQVAKTYHQLSMSPGEYRGTAEALYDELFSDNKHAEYFERSLPFFNVPKLNSPWAYVFFLFKTIKHLLGAIKRWVQYVKNVEPLTGNVHPLSLLGSFLNDAWQRQYMRFQVYQPNFGEKLSEGQKYLYYPLPMSTEYSTQFTATMWVNQIYLIEQLAKSIPSDWILYVKEHPATVYWRARPASFYKQIKRLPNVQLAPIDMDGHQLIAEAEMVAVITGTSGWEAIQMNKPLITFADNYYDVLNLSRKCSDMDNLPREILEEYKRSQTISGEERRRRIIHFLAAILDHSFVLTYPNQFCYEKGSNEQLDISAKEVSEALKEYLNNIRANPDVSLSSSA
jgi:hypothetical protein